MVNIQFFLRKGIKFHFPMQRVARVCILLVMSRKLSLSWFIVHEEHINQKCRFPVVIQSFVANVSSLSQLETNNLWTRFLQTLVLNLYQCSSFFNFSFLIFFFWKDIKYAALLWRLCDDLNYKIHDHVLHVSCSSHIS